MNICIEEKFHKLQINMLNCYGKFILVETFKLQRTFERFYGKLTFRFKIFPKDIYIFFRIYISVASCRRNFWH